MSQLRCSRFIFKTVLILALVAKAKGCLLAKRCQTVVLLLARVAFKDRALASAISRTLEISSKVHMLEPVAPHLSRQPPSLLSPTTFQTCLQHKRGPRMPKQRVAEDKLVKLLMFTGDPGAMKTVTLTSEPDNLEQMTAFQTLYLLRGAL